MSEAHVWTYSDYDYLYNNHHTIGPLECAKHIGCSISAVIDKSSKLGLTNSGEFTDKEIKLAKAYGSVLKGSLIFLLPHRTSPEIEELIACSKKQ